jgi:hypothetical protein
MKVTEVATNQHTFALCSAAYLPELRRSDDLPALLL